MCKIKLLLLCISIFQSLWVFAQNNSVEIQNSEFSFTWDLPADEAAIVSSKGDVWKGSLLPSYWIADKSNKKQFVEAVFIEKKVDSVFFELKDVGKGFLTIIHENDLIKIKHLEVNWNTDDIKIISLNFGLKEMTSMERLVVPDLEEPCWPDWQADGYCIPTAKGAPIQSFFRFWQFGNSSIPLGNFGSSLGTPYAAAFPRPLYAMAMGGSNGWCCFGAGQIPDGAMVLKLKTASSYLHFLYREDLWGAPKGRTRIWENPVYIAMSKKAWDAYRKLFSGLEANEPVDHKHQVNHWNTWGDFKNNRFNMDDIIAKAERFEAEIITWDMMWETFECSGKPDFNRFPEFNAELNKMREKGFKVGFWQSVLWVKDYQAVGLTKDDVICGKDGKPRLVNWINSPFNTNQFYYAIDPSSKNAVHFLEERTKYIVKNLGADLLKLDFAYNIPSPNVGAPRNSDIRGERYGYTLLKIIADAAREVNQDITLQYYGISPLMHDCYNLVALDDMGDAGNWEKEGHGQWSIWAALSGIQGRAIMASSGYDWDADKEVLLNTAIIGSPGLVLPGNYNGGSIPKSMLAKRIAIARWYRRTIGWEPLWLNSHKGSLEQAPTPNCWGRLEVAGEKKLLVALALRQDNIEELDNKEINGITFTGEWALISQDKNSIYKTQKLAVIAFQNGELNIPTNRKPAWIRQVFEDKEVEYTNWSYNNDSLKLRNDKDFNEKAQCGFLIVWNE